MGNKMNPNNQIIKTKEWLSYLFNVKDGVIYFNSRPACNFPLEFDYIQFEKRFANKPVAVRKRRGKLQREIINVPFPLELKKKSGRTHAQLAVRDVIDILKAKRVTVPHAPTF